MAEAIMNFTLIKPHIQNSIHSTKFDTKPSSRSLRQVSITKFNHGWQKIEENKRKRESLSKMNALPDWPLMAVLVEQVEGNKEFITNKSIWHLSDRAIKNVYTFYIMFTCWGCLFFGSTKDPYYDSDAYRKDGGDGTGFWLYEKQEDVEETSRAELWREELIEEIEEKVGGLRELEEAGRK